MLSTSSSQHFFPQYNNPHQQPFYFSTSTQQEPSPKRTKFHHPSADISSTVNFPGFSYHPSMNQPLSQQRHLAPHINVQRASEPTSPSTINSTISSHSSPAPSPSRVHIVEEGSHDFTLFDDYHIQEAPSKQHSRVPRQFQSTTSNPSPLNARFNTDPSWQHYSDPTAMDVSKVPSHTPVYALHQRMMAPNRYHPYLHHQSVVEDEPPALSPSRPNTCMSTSSRPSHSENDTPRTPRHSAEHERAFNGPIATARKNTSDIDEWIEQCLQADLEQGIQTGPKLNRTISDAVQDELYNPGIAPGTTHSHHPTESISSPSQLPQLFQQAQSQHMARAPPQQNQFRDNSPFRATSPYHPARSQADASQTSPRAATFLPVGFSTARAQRERERDQQAEQAKARMEKELQELQQPPKTISPQDACLDYHAPEGGFQGSLFENSQHDDSASQHSTASGSYHSSNMDDDEIKMESNYDTMNGHGNGDVSMEYNMPMTYVNIPQHYGQNLNLPAGYGWADHSSSSDPVSRNSVSADEYGRPDDVTANTGAYSCTVHGCSLRFPTASKMSKHRREAHRHGTPSGGNLTVRAQHQGPHECNRINPTTGKPCKTQFSRPYDLTRHEDTIHNIHRQKVRCELCNDDKTFSRADALTRHKKVKHGIEK
ncbi:hypothetical protein EX30DRAFT_168203 [Ascodesmis nigricans]|uniref:C2H2-type domain-containing protein n=1 Tax=Ascodesmis nigricans TaxID=341454 RepID=A0A4S2MM37_9PEZI|nr:hypothetical protein EX30DRAFT_168203 [Ascodesmis nigricans]